MFAPLVSERALKILSWASLVSQILIVVTGGAVRLTASGLGCPTWPTCTENSLVTVPAMGIHGVIEFGNRLLTFVLLLIALWTLVAVVARGKSRRLRGPAIALLVGIFVQAVVGGISVLVKLNPWVVGSHFVISALMICIAAILLWRTYSPSTSLATALESRLAVIILFTGMLTELFGVVVTGSGPHAGDSQTPRNGLDSELWQHIHSLPAYASIVFTFWLLVKVRRRDVDGYASRLVFWTWMALTLQASLGITQARLGLPVELVIVHLLLASISCALFTLIWLSLKHKNDA